jgi:hypothetical protein
MIGKMKNKQQIQEEVDKTLESLDSLQKATANPYLFTRIKARLEREEKSFWSRSITFISRPAVAIMAILLATTINAIVFFESRTETVQTTQEGEQLFASEYNLTDSTIYDSTIDPE